MSLYDSVALSRSVLPAETGLSVMVMEYDGRPLSQSEPDALSAMGGSERLVPGFTARPLGQPPAQLPLSEPGLAVRPQAVLQPPSGVQPGQPQ